MTTLPALASFHVRASLNKDGTYYLRNADGTGSIDVPAEAMALSHNLIFDRPCWVWLVGDAVVASVRAAFGATR